MIELSMEESFEILIKGALVLIGLAIAAVFLIPIGIGYILVRIAMVLIDIIRPVLFPEKRRRIYQASKEDLARMAEKIDREKQQAKVEEPEPQAEEEPAVEPEDEPEIEEPKEIVFHKNFYLESRLNYGQKEALFAQGYKRLKISPYGDSGAAYYWVKTRYNESKEHAFFCYLIEKELRKHTKEIDLFVNNGPDVIVRYSGNVYAFDVETGKNLIRKPEQTKEKFEGYKEDYYCSYIFVTSKALKHKYHRMGIVITRSTFRKIIAEIFS